MERKKKLKAIDKRRFKKFKVGEYYTIPYICEICDIPEPASMAQKNELWERMELSGAKWERKGNKYFTFMGMVKKKDTDKKVKEKQQDEESMAAIKCARTVLISNGFSGLWLTRNEISKILFGYEIWQMFVPVRHYDKIQYGMSYGRACEIFNGNLRIIIETMIHEFSKGWEDNAKRSVLIDKDRISRSYYYTDKKEDTGEVHVAAEEMAAEIGEANKSVKHDDILRVYCGTRNFKKSWGRNFKVLDLEKKYNITIGEKIYKYDFADIKLPDKYDNYGRVEDVLREYLKKRLFQRLNCDKRKKETYYPGWIKKDEVEIVEKYILKIYSNWCDIYDSDGFMDRSLWGVVNGNNTDCRSPVKPEVFIDGAVNERNYIFND